MGAAIEQVPGIVKAKEMGYEVAVIDYNDKAIGIQLADKFYNISTIDSEGVLRVAREFNPDGFLTLATDLPMRSVAYASESIGLRGISEDTALLATDKGEMIRCLKSNHVATPWYFLINSIEDINNIESKLKYPCILKPTDNAGSRGVTYINDYNDLIRNFNYSKEYSHSGQVIIEEYMQGPEVSVEILAYKGVPHIIQITDKKTTGAPHFVEIGHDQPTKLNSVAQEMIIDLAKRAVIALGIENGPAHVEIILTKDGPKIVELGARLGGDCITSHLVYLSTGIDMIKETIKVLCGEVPDLTIRENKGASVRFCVSENQGIFDHIEGIDEALSLEGVTEVTSMIQKGESLQSVNSSDDRIAFVITQGENSNDSASVADKACALLSIKILEE